MIVTPPTIEIFQSLYQSTFGADVVDNGYVVIEGPLRRIDGVEAEHSMYLVIQNKETGEFWYSYHHYDSWNGSEGGGEWQSIHQVLMGDVIMHEWNVIR